LVDNDQAKAIKAGSRGVSAPVGVKEGQRTENGRQTICLQPHEFRVLGGRWDRNRTCTLRFWSTRCAVWHRPTASKHVQPVCSQFCSQHDL